MKLADLNASCQPFHHNDLCTKLTELKNAFHRADVVAPLSMFDVVHSAVAHVSALLAIESVVSGPS